jgi:hypothetical protein
MQSFRVAKPVRRLLSVFLLMVCTTIAACSSTQQKPPACEGEYQRINPLNRYPAVGDHEPYSKKAKDANDDENSITD